MSRAASGPPDRSRETWPASERACSTTTTGRRRGSDERVRPVPELNHVRAHGRDELLVDGRADVRDLGSRTLPGCYPRAPSPRTRGPRRERRRRKTLHCHRTSIIVARFALLRPSLDRGFTTPVHGEITRAEVMLRYRPVHRAGGGGLPRLRVRGERGLRAPVRAHEPGLPPVERRVVAQLEVEEARRRRAGSTRAAPRPRAARPAGPRRPGACRSPCRCSRARPGDRLEAVLEVPDGDAAAAGQRLRGAVRSPCGARRAGGRGRPRRSSASACRGGRRAPRPTSRDTRCGRPCRTPAACGRSPCTPCRDPRTSGPGSRAARSWRSRSRRAAPRAARPSTSRAAPRRRLPRPCAAARTGPSSAPSRSRRRGSTGTGAGRSR